jgi:hypothetical protein
LTETAPLSVQPVQGCLFSSQSDLEVACTAVEKVGG